jgi:nickel/cobalt exporter
MPRKLMFLGLALAACVLALWAMGAMDGLARWMVEAQRQSQNAIAGALRRLRGGEPGALMALIGLAFAYGVFHAAGPGHGKVLIGGYGLARRVRLWPLISIAVASSLAQATSAVALVYAGVLVLNLTREAMVGLAEDVFAPISYAAIGLIGLWLALRGARGLRRAWAVVPHHDHDHHDTACGECGHSHGPSMVQIEAVSGWRDAAVLIGGVALRPCTGALFLLILCWRMGIDAVGIAGAYAMGLGTASITVAVAVLSVWAREGAIEMLSQGRLARALPLVELGAGLAICLLSLQMLRTAL